MGNEGGSKKPWVSIVVALITGVLTNFDRIVPGIQAMVMSPAVRSNKVAGQWNGIFREYDPAKKGETITYDTMQLEKRGESVSGKMGTPADGEVRAWEVAGIFKHSMLALTYLSSDPEIRSVGSIVLQGRPGEDSVLKGYWLGYDRDRRQLLTCPYVLTRRTDTEEVKKENAAWLGAPCYGPKSGDGP